MKIFTRKQGKTPQFACSSEGWLAISQEILFHLEFPLTTQGIKTAFSLSQRMNLGHKNQQFFKKTPCGSTSSKNPTAPMQTCTGWAEFSQCWLSRAADSTFSANWPPNLHWFTQNCTSSPWKERAEFPHIHPRIPASTGSYWGAVLQNYQTLSSFFCKKELKMRFYNPTSILQARGMNSAPPIHGV